MSNIFSYSGLKKFLRAAADYGEVNSFEGIKSENGIILRHDVDFDVEPAYQLAQMEKKCGVNSTFFFLTSSPTYNLNSSNNRKMLKDLSDDNFEVGLHFDPTIYPNEDHEGLEKRAIFEASIIENIIEKKVKSLSLHNPSIHGQYPMFDSFINAYAPKYFQPNNYMSDSRMTFRDKLPYKFLEKAQNTRLQILLHPIHYSEKGDNYRNLMRDCIYRFTDKLHEYIKENSQYVNDMQGSTLREVL